VGNERSAHERRLKPCSDHLSVLRGYQIRFTPGDIRAMGISELIGWPMLLEYRPAGAPKPLERRTSKHCETRTRSGTSVATILTWEMGRRAARGWYAAQTFCRISDARTASGSSWFISSLYIAGSV
jgi:hypothetical protein